MFIYFTIFVFKIIENTLSTLRLILVADGKKKLGAILQGIISLIWIISTSIVIINIDKNPLKIIFFCLGAIIGSYLGSLIEEKIALGNSLLFCYSKKQYETKIKNKLLNYNISIINENNNKIIIIIFIKRTKINKTVKLLKKIDKDIFIISEKANFF